MEHKTLSDLTIFIDERKLASKLSNQYGVDEFSCLVYAIEKVCPHYIEEIEREFNHVKREERLANQIIQLQNELKEIHKE